MNFFLAWKRFFACGQYKLAFYNYKLVITIFFNKKKFFYRPLGNIIATTRIIDNQRFVWFFERNGQYRGNFCLDMPLIDNNQKRSVIKYLSWNIDATILAIHFVEYAHVRKESEDLELNNKSFN